MIHVCVKDIDAVSEEFGFPWLKKGSPGGNATSQIRTVTGRVSLRGAPDHEA